MKIGYKLNSAKGQFDKLDAGVYTDGCEIKADYGVNLFVVFDAPIVKCISAASLYCNNKTLGKFSVECVFSVEKDCYDKFYDVQSNEIRVPKDFAAHLFSIGIGALRGYVCAKLEGVVPEGKFAVGLVDTAALIGLRSSSDYLAFEKPIV